MSLWFSDESMEEMSWAYGCSLEGVSVEEDIPDVELIERNYKSLDLYKAFYVNNPESQEVKDKLSSLACDVHIFNTRIILIKKGISFEDIKNQVKETWGKDYFNTDISEDYLYVKYGRKITSSIPDELVKIFNVSDSCLEIVDKKISIRDINRSIGKIFNINILFFYIQRYVKATNEKVVEELFNLDLMDWDMIYEYKGKSTLVELCRDYPKVLDDFIRMLETKVAPALDKLGAEYIPFKPMLLSFKKKVLNGQIK